MFGLRKKRNNPDDGGSKKNNNQDPIVKLVNAIVQQAAADRALQIYFKPMAPDSREYNCIQATYAREGAEIHAMTIPANLAPPILDRLRALRDDPCERKTVEGKWPEEYSCDITLTDDALPAIITLKPAKEWKKAHFQLAYEAIQFMAEQLNMTGQELGIMSEHYIPPQQERYEDHDWKHVPKNLQTHLESVYPENKNARWFAQEYDKFFLVAGTKAAQEGLVLLPTAFTEK